MLMTDVKLLSKKIRTLLYLITTIFAGFLLKGIPNVLVPIEFTLITISEGGEFIHIFYPVAIFCVIIGTSFIVGRIFCGYACPIGALQEIISTLNFKSDLKTQSAVERQLGIVGEAVNK